ncbi:MAG: hypothetical protein ABL883_14790 [Terricaulis sp.]
MTATPHAAKALTSALGRFENASGRWIEAAIGAGSADAQMSALAGIIQARAQVQATVAVQRFSDDMWDSVLELQSGGGASV